MPTVLESLVAARDGAAAKLAEALAGDYTKAIEFKPDFNGANSLDRVSYIRELRATIADLNKQISQMDVFEATSEMAP